MIPHRPPAPDHPHAPEVKTNTIQQRHARQDREPPRAGQGDVVAEIEQSRGDGAEDDAEFEPGEEGPLGGEVDFWFHADGDVDAFAARGAEAAR